MCAYECVFFYPSSLPVCVCVCVCVLTEIFSDLCGVQRLSLFYALSLSLSLYIYIYIYVYT